MSQPPKQHQLPSDQVFIVLRRGRPERFWTTESNEKLNLGREGGEVGGLDRGDDKDLDSAAGTDDDVTCVVAVGFPK